MRTFTVCSIQNLLSASAIRNREGPSQITSRGPRNYCDELHSVHLSRKFDYRQSLGYKNLARKAMTGRRACTKVIKLAVSASSGYRLRSYPRAYALDEACTTRLISLLARLCHCGLVSTFQTKTRSLRVIASSIKASLKFPLFLLASWRHLASAAATMADSSGVAVNASRALFLVIATKLRSGLMTAFSIDIWNTTTIPELPWNDNAAYRCRE